MSSLPIFDIAGSGMSAQQVRMSTVASNIANAESVSGNPEETYKARFAVFKTAQMGTPEAVGVQVSDVIESKLDAVARYLPGHPQADEKGYVYAPNLDPVTLMVELISTQRNYQTNVEVMNTAKDLTLATINMGR